MQLTQKVYIPVINREKFEKMSRADQRIAICKDVLARLDAGFLITSPGMFVGDTYYTQIDINHNKCEVCGKGAIACAWLGSLNKFSHLHDFDVDARRIDREGTQEIIKVFGRDLWDAIECAFELCSFHWHCDFIQDNRDNIVSTFGGMFSKSRLIAIMNNIIKNNGAMKLLNGELIGEIE